MYNSPSSCDDLELSVYDNFCIEEVSFNYSLNKWDSAGSTSYKYKVDIAVSRVTFVSIVLFISKLILSWK